MMGLAWNLHAGGSGLNTVVIVNPSSADSLELGNYFCERRQVPPQNVLRVNWSGSKVSWTSAEFQSTLLSPLTTMLSSRRLTNQIDYVVLSLDFPFQTLYGSAVNSTTSALFYGLKTDSDTDSANVVNLYAASEQSFRDVRPASASAPGFLTTMLTAGSLAQAKALVDQGVNGDATFPAQTALLAKSSDATRNIRYRLFDNAIINVLLVPGTTYSLTRVTADIPPTTPPLLGLQTGLAYFSVPAGSFVPGAMADSMTSFGGILTGGGQTTLLEFIHAGAAGSYGTVTEPHPVVEKFPNPQAYFYQARGFTLAECYYQSLVVPYQGLIVAEPLSAPFQRLATANWSGVTSNAVLSGTRPLTVSFTAADERHPLQQIDLFVDGQFWRTLTNLPPQPGNIINLTVNQQPLTLEVPAGATIGSLASSLATLINQPANGNASRVTALAHGDRIELRSISPARLPPPTNLRLADFAPPGTPSFPVTISSPPLARTATGTAGFLSTFVTASRERFLDSPAFGRRSFSVNGSVQIGTWLRLTITKANGATVSIGVTNQSTGSTGYELAGSLVNAVNRSPALQDVDGVLADDLSPWFSSGALFNLVARSPGLAGADIRAQLRGGGLALEPDGPVNLTENLADLQPRNHLYVTAGAMNLNAAFSLDTTKLADGFHELTAVAYEGSHVRTQTRVTIPVHIQNTSLEGELSFGDGTEPAEVGNTYQIHVAANASNVSTIELFSTGGPLGTVSNQSAATFAVSGSILGAGLHPFYAVITTSDGRQYRTATRWVRLVAGT